MSNEPLMDPESPVCRGKRLRRLRNLANLSRENMCNVKELNATTYKGWEIGRFRGISKKGAINVIRRVSKEGVICTLEWLWQGKGQPPTVIPKTDDGKEWTAQPHSLELQEIIVFQNNFDNATYSEINDDGISPQYNIGDYVAGIKKYGKEIDTLLGEVCIVHTASNNVLVRQLLRGETKKGYVLVCTNPKSSVEKTALCGVKLHAAARIKRHYKK